MSRYRKLTADGDYTIGTGADFFVDQPDLVAQSVLTRLRLFTGEWFLDTKEGTPWRTDVLGKYTKDVYDTVIKQRILGTPGVLSILSYESLVDSESRTLSVTVTLDTIYTGQAATPGAGNRLDIDFILDLSTLG